MKHSETVHLLHKYVWKLTWHTNLSILFGEEVNKAKTSVIPWTSCFLWKTDCLQLSKCTERTEGRNQTLLLNYLAPNFPHTMWIQTVLCVCDGYQKSSRSSLIVAWKGMLRTRILDPVCFFSTCFFLRDTSVVLHTGEKPNHQSAFWNNEKPISDIFMCISADSDTNTFHFCARFIQWYNVNGDAWSSCRYLNTEVATVLVYY